MEYKKSKGELSRRKFLQKSTSFALGTPIIIASIGDSGYLTQTELTCRDISDHFRFTCEDGRSCERTRFPDDYCKSWCC